MTKTSTRMSYRPLLDNIVVKPIQPAKVTKGGILLPDKAQQRPERGTVLAVGPGKYNRDGELLPIPELKKGQTVMFSRYGGHEIEHEGETVLIISASEVLAIVHDE